VFGVTVCWKVKELLERFIRIKNGGMWLYIILTVTATLLVVF